MYKLPFIVIDEQLDENFWEAAGAKEVQLNWSRKSILSTSYLFTANCLKWLSTFMIK